MHGRVEIQSHAFVILALNVSEWSAPRPDCIIPRKWAPITHCLEGCVAPTAGLDVLEKKKFALSKNLTLILRSSSSLLPNHHTDWTTVLSITANQ
jgi:hypothetical protein